MHVIISGTVALNGGDFAILDAVVKSLQNATSTKIKFTVYDKNPEVASRYYNGIDFRHSLYFKHTNKSHKKIISRFVEYTNRLTQKRFIQAAKFYSQGKEKLAYLLLTKSEKEDFDNYKNADIIISTGGTYLVEIYSLASRYFDFYFSLALRKPLVFFTQSLGPFDDENNKTHIKRIFDKAALVLLRDQASFNNLTQINVDTSHARVCADIVFAVADKQLLEEAKSRQFNKILKIGISVREWGHFTDQTSAEGMEKFIKSVVALCEYIITTLKGEVYFISTCQGIEEYHFNDSDVSKDIYELLSKEAKAGSEVDDKFYNPDQLKEIIRNFDMVLSTRMHFAIQSLSIGVPVLPVAYEFKTNELFNKLIDEDCILDINTISESVIITAFKKLLKTLPENRCELFTKVETERLSALDAVKYLKEKFLSIE